MKTKRVKMRGVEKRDLNKERKKYKYEALRQDELA